jgi:ribosomal protein S18 acetylase RimI-like enzyme
MEIIQIRNTDSPLFERVWEIYRYSFPIYEHRTFEHQQTAFKSPLYHLDAYLNEGVVIGFIAYWIFPDYAYIEHYAMAQEARGQGYGTKILGDFLRRMAGRVVVLEIDPVIDEVSTRRLEFYQRLGFQESPFRHTCPKYQPDEKEGELWVLTWPATVDCDFYEMFYNDLHQVVLARE